MTPRGLFVAGVRHYLRHRQMVDDVLTGEGRVESLPVPVLIDRDMQVLERVKILLDSRGMMKESD